MGKVYEIEKIEPREILTWFKKICSIPHGSFKEKELATTLTKDLIKAGCTVQVLSSGALYIQQKATFGHDNWPTVLLQGHLDMVQAADEGVVIDFDKDPIKVYYDTDNGWLKAEGTTLGADNGVSISMIMQLLTDPNIEHGPLEALFTVGEEVDTGPCMESIPNGLLQAKYYLNLDSAYDNKIFYASAGAGVVSYKLPLQYTQSPEDVETYEIILKNFAGGHSALDIHFPHINPIIFTCKTLLAFSHDVSQINLISMNGGLVPNAIPTDVKFTIKLKNGFETKLEQYFNNALDIAKVACQGKEKDAEFVINKVEDVKLCVDATLTNKILGFYAFAPNDMFVVNETGKEMFNSSNVGFVKTEDAMIRSTFMPRSYYRPDLQNLLNLFTIYAKNNGAVNVESKIACESWLTPDFENSYLINLWRKNYISVVGSEPLILPNPGGLEVAEIITKNEKMLANAMSTGPIIFKEHSTYEHCPVKSINKIWTILKLTLKGLDK